MCRSLIVAHLAFIQKQDERATFFIAGGMQFEVQAAFGASDTSGNIRQGQNPLDNRRAYCRVSVAALSYAPVVTHVAINGNFARSCHHVVDCIGCIS